MDDPRGAERLRALDGLRGVAALVVLLSHVVLASAGPLADALTLGGSPADPVEWALARTPLAIGWAGPELVLVFFTLSGYVLTRALASAPRHGVAGYYAGRLIRLYLPVWAAVLLGAALLWLVPRGAGALAPTLWLADFVGPVGADVVGANVALVVPQRGSQLNGVLWSLRWEVLFSALLPVILLGAGPLRRRGPAIAAVVLALLLAAVPHGSAAGYAAAPFVLGTLMALHPQAIVAVRDRLAGRRPGAYLVLTVVLLTGDLWMPADPYVAGSGGALVVAGALLAVAAPLLYPGMARVLEGRPLQWLGSRSFSLYLVHEPLVVTLAFALHGPSLLVLLPLALASAAIATELFHRAVERPVHRLARSVRAPRAQVAAPAAVTPALA